MKDDIIELSAGNQIPADARVVGGEVMVNESLLTGEADEVKKNLMICCFREVLLCRESVMQG